MAKSTTVELVVKAYGMRETFEVTHAQRLLSLPNNGGWELPEDSEYEYENGIISRRSKVEGKGRKGQGSEE